MREHADSTDGTDRAALPPVRAVRLDSREVEPGDLFVCIAGQRADGHDFAAAAVAAGAAALV
ncbi:MAG: Mur ligase domain-containing protein, partial [Chloroflexi bacterium]|nr:Mur ligase domain-containing protein [Chloroflexota bacterium]